jgi:hypothetical protein
MICCSVNCDFLGMTVLHFALEDSRCDWSSFRGAPHLHIAFAAPSHEAVDRFHASALSAGSVDEGKPGIREDYAPDHYAAFVFDPGGHRVEAVVYPPPRIEFPLSPPLTDRYDEARQSAAARRILEEFRRLYVFLHGPPVQPRSASDRLERPELSVQQSAIASLKLLRGERS